MTREENAALNMRECKEGRLTLESKPLFVFVELTQNCNLSCAMCRSAVKNRPEWDMPRPVALEIVRELAGTALICDLHGWGESTIVPWLPELVGEAASRGARVRLVTNAHAITKAVWRGVFESDGVIAVSFDAANPQLFSALGRGDFGRVLGAVSEGMRLQQRIGRGTVYFNTVVSAANIADLPNIVDTAATLGVPKVVLNPVKGWAGTSADLENCESRVPGILQDAEERARRRGLVLQLGTWIKGLDVDADGLPSVCSNPWNRVLFNVEGAVLFCDHLVNKTEYSMGSYRDQPFMEIWNNPSYQTLRQAHLDARLRRTAGPKYPKCNWCYQYRYGDSESAPEPGGRNREVSTTTRTSLVTRSAGGTSARLHMLQDGCGTMQPCGWPSESLRS